MHCEQCGNENRQDSKFCKSCGNKLQHGETATPSGLRINRKKILLYTGVLIAILVVCFGSYKVYAYSKVQSKINLAKKLQSQGDYTESSAAIATIDSRGVTSKQKESIATINTNDQKYLGFKTSFDAVVAEEINVNGTPASPETLKTAQASLELITTDYPDYQNVQTELTKIQNSLVTGLETEASTNEAAATSAQAAAQRNQAAAASAQAAKNQAVAAAQAAQQQASASAAAAEQASAARAAEVEKGFKNELTTAYNSYYDGYQSYSTAIHSSNNGDSASALATAISAGTSLNNAYNDTSDLSTRYTGLPASYYIAASDMISAINDLKEALTLMVDTEGTSVDDSSTINSYKDQSYSYGVKVSSFLSDTSS